MLGGKNTRNATDRQALSLSNHSMCLQRIPDIAVATQDSLTGQPSEHSSMRIRSTIMYVPDEIERKRQLITLIGRLDCTSTVTNANLTQIIMCAAAFRIPPARESAALAVFDIQFSSVALSRFAVEALDSMLVRCLECRGQQV